MAVRTDLFRIVHQDLTAWIVMDCQPVFHEHPLSVSHQALMSGGKPYGLSSGVIKHSLLENRRT